MKYEQRKEARVRRAVRQLRDEGLREFASALGMEVRRLLLQFGRYGYWFYLRTAPAKTFRFRGEEYRYFNHPYNATWRNERTVEVPIVRRAIHDRRPGRLLEIGNVLGHYFDAPWDVVDKYEPGAGVLNVDILDFRPERPYDLIVSISTLEHVGWDDEDRDRDKIPRAIEHIRSLLAPRGRAVVTLPLGYNRDLDELVDDGRLGLDGADYLLRTGPRDWREATKHELGRLPYGEPYPGANGLLVGEIEPRR